MDIDKKDFLLHLYDKLWENMNSKEGRVWNFLALYGAGIAITFGAGKLAGLELYALIFVLILTYWALLIVTNSNWWYWRNLLLVTRIEGEFEAGLIGVVPRLYRENPKFEFDRLHESTIYILLITGALFFAKSVLKLGYAGSVTDRGTAASLIIAYLVFVLGVFYWLRSHEHFIRRYYEVKVDLWAEAEQKKDADKRKTRDQIQAEMAKEESTTRASFNWRRYAVAATVFGSASLDFVAQRNAAARSYLLVVAGAMQLAATVLSVWLAARYGAQDPRLGALSGKPGRKFWKLSVAGAVYGLLILSCVVLLFVVQINKAQAPPPVWGP